jgi:hypothetical protein
MSQPKVLIAFYSRSGVTEAFAKPIAAGARASGAEVRLRRAREFVSADVMAQAPGWAEQAAVALPAIIGAVLTLWVIRHARAERVASA